jgi:LysR family transcriptional regulator of abg operon
VIKIQHIEMLIAIERAGSIRAASKLLGKTQPAVTKALRQAEAELGAAIFKRAPSGVVVTEEGKPILRRARVIQSELRKMQEEVEQQRGLGTGQLNVTVSPLAASQIIASAIKIFRKRFPHVKIQIRGGHEPMAFGPVRDGQVDMVIGPEPLGTDTAGLSVSFLIETPIVVITGKNSRWSKETSLEALAQGDWLMIGSRERLPYLRRHFNSRGIEPPEPLITSDSINSVLSLVQDGEFLCTFPGLLLDHTQERWDITVVPLSEALQSAKIAIITSSERPPTPALLHFCDCVSQITKNEFGT